MVDYLPSHCYAYRSSILTFSICVDAFPSLAQDAGLAANEVLAALLLPSAHTRSLSALVVWHWIDQAAICTKEWSGTTAGQAIPAAGPTPAAPPPAAIMTALQGHLAAPGPSMPSAPTSADPYSEVVPYYAQMRREAFALIGVCMQVSVTDGYASMSIYGR